MTDKDIEIEHLKKALEESKKENKALKGKLKTAKSKKDKAQQELKSLKKKLPEQTDTTEETINLLMNMLDDTNILKR